VSLASSSPGTASVPASVTVLAGATSGTFAVAAGAVSSGHSATVTASYGGTSAQATLTVTPQQALSFSSLSVYATWNWNAAGYPAINEVWTIVPDGQGTFTVAGASTPAFAGCAASLGNTAFTCGTLAPGLQLLDYLFPSGSSILESVSSGSLTLTLQPGGGPTTIVGALGTASGTLSLTATPVLGGATQAYSGSISGGQFAINY
jgi:hypothetical protein